MKKSVLSYGDMRVIIKYDDEAKNKKIFKSFIVFEISRCKRCKLLHKELYEAFVSDKCICLDDFLDKISLEFHVPKITEKINKINNTVLKKW